ncbi:hypothetical protein AVEN_173156-1 [Araneus ventricosus]|uniref:Uncharacterized protein n=1 Tax=Araneus ventricosus TaxID=182803 RepID=A0A4Y2HS88_ARAVE|nr:hypothetical protein AVEN_173156-1 [Araneus ventricosus]
MSSVTVLSIALSSEALKLARQTKLKVIPRRRSHSKDVPHRILHRIFIVYLTGRDVAWKSPEKSGSRLLKEISRKLLHFRESSICRQNGRQCQDSSPGRCRHSILTLFPTIGVARQESDTILF